MGEEEGEEVMGFIRDEHGWVHWDRVAHAALFLLFFAAVMGSIIPPPTDGPSYILRVTYADGRTVIYEDARRFRNHGGLFSADGEDSYYVGGTHVRFPADATVFYERVE